MASSQSPNPITATSQSQPPPPPQTETSTSLHTTNPNSPTDNTSSATIEQSLREELHKFKKNISKREPLNPTYTFLLLKNSYIKAPKLIKDKLYNNKNSSTDSNLRENVEYYMNKYGTETPTDDARKYTIGRHRQNLNESKMRDAFTIRECKEHEQRDLIHASLLASNARFRPGSLINEGVRKRKTEIIADSLLEGDRKKKQREQDRKYLHAAKQKILNYEKKQLEIQRDETDDAVEAAKITEQLKLTEKQSMDVRVREQEESERREAIEREKEREKERIAAEKRERARIKKEKEEAARKARLMETPSQALQRLYKPMFTTLWDLEFWDGLNPFRIVIDKNNCADMGIPDYCDIIKEPMNLTYIKEKVEHQTYVTLQAFFDDIELLINNALLYNSDPNNPYHVAAIKMKNKYLDLRRKLMLQIESSKSS